MIALDKPYKYVLAAGLLALVYVITGLLGLTLAVPPGYATVFWPPSGFAVAAIYIFGYRMSVGVFWGAFLTHVINYIALAGVGLDTIQYLNGICIALGATTQALVAAYLLKKFVAPQTKLENFSEILKFSLLAGPISCLLSASVGAGTLFLSSSIPLSNVPYTWASWYVGDILGVLVFSPILVIILTGKSISLQRKLYTTIPMIVVFTLVVFSFLTVREADEEARIKKFQATAALIKKELDYKMSEHFSMLKSMRALYESSEYVDFNEFSVFASHTIDTEKLMGGIGYAPLLNDEDSLALLQKRAEAIGLKDFKLKDFNKDHDGHCEPLCTPLLYIYPIETHKKVAGLDLAKNQKRLDTIQKVIATGVVNISDKITLSRSKKNGFLSVMPILNSDATDEQYDGTRSIKGFIFGGSSYEIMFSSVLDAWHDSGIHLLLYDAGKLVYDDAEEHIGYKEFSHSKNPFVFSFKEEIAGRSWRFEFVMDKNHILANVNWNIWFALAASLFFTFFTTVFLLAVTGQTAAVEDIVIQKTKELSDNNKFLKIVMDSVPDLVFVKNRFLQIVQANKSFLELFPPDESESIIGRTGFENFPKSEVELFKQQDQRALEYGYSESFEPITNYKGETRNHFMRKISFTTESGIQYLLGIGRDLTQEQETMDRLQKSEERFRASIENAPIGMSLVGVDQSWILYNKALADMLDYSYEEFGKKTLVEMTHPDDVNKDADEIKELLSGNIQNYSVEKRYQKKDGSFIWVYLTLAVVKNGENKPQYYVAHALDITVRKQAEQLQLQVAKMVDSAVTEFYIFDAKTFKFLDINKAALDNLGYTAAYLLKKTPAFIQKNMSKSKLLKIIEPLQNGELSSLEFDTQHRRKNGSIYDVLVNLQLIDYNDSKAYMAIVLDITERKQMENDLKRSNKELEEFAYVASHDLKAPLRHVALSADFLSHQYKDKLDDKAGEFLDIMTKSTKRMQNMIDSLLEYSRVGRQSKDDMEVLDLQDIINETLETLKPAISEKNAVINVSKMPDQVKCNRTLMLQLFQNLLQNAMKYKKDDVDPVIDVDAELVGRNVIISVADNGIGIEKDYAEKIFQVFRRLHHNEDKYDGTGIGLAICQRIVETHEGEISLDNEYTGGCRFVIKLPIAV